MSTGAVPAPTPAVRSIRTWPCLIGGVPRDVPEHRDVVSPWDGSVASRIAWAGPAEVREAARAGAAAMRRPLSPVDREEILGAAATLVAERAEELATTITRESGKPISAARVEVARAARTLQLSAAEAIRIGGQQVPLGTGSLDGGPLALTVRKPAGVVGAVTPFNWPLNLVVHKVGPALAAGCAVVLKPSEAAPGAAVLLCRILTEAGLPDGWMSVVAGPAPSLVQQLLDAPEVRLVTFTGSSRIGWDLHGRARGKRVTLELGNVTPVIVAADADLDRAVPDLVAGAFTGSGQACISVQRIYVHESIHAPFAERFVEATRAVRAGDPADPDTVVGPLISASATERAVSWITEARSAGARVATGGEVTDGVLAPTVLFDVPEGLRIATEEAFAPVVCIWPFRHLQEAVAAANSTPQGLQAGIFTGSLRTAMSAVSALDFGSVVVNRSPSWRADEMPYGGLKDSGNTREGPGRAVLEMTEECLAVMHW